MNQSTETQNNHGIIIMITSFLAMIFLYIYNNTHLNPIEEIIYGSLSGRYYFSSNGLNLLEGSSSYIADGLNKKWLFFILIVIFAYGALVRKKIFKSIFIAKSQAKNKEEQRSES